jgi:adenosylcobinamide-GDP ribazoletransferase
VSWTRAWRTALSLFTVIPAGTGETLGEDEAAHAVLWMPAVGMLLGVPGGAVVAGAGGLGAADSGLRRLLGATLAIALVGLLTGGLHLDGLADTADGLGSRRPASAALDIMRRSDVGPMGVATLVLVLLIQVTALAAVPRASAAGLALVLATVTGRVAVVLATGSHPARPGGFGALVAGRTTGRARTMTVVVLGCAIVAAGFGFGGLALAVRGLVAAAVGLAAGWAVRLIAVRRLGGVTGDVFGAVLEIAAAATLVTCALTA